MKKSVGIILVIFACLLYLLGLLALAGQLEYSLVGLMYTLSEPVLARSFLASAAGALLPGVVVHYLGYRLIRSSNSATKL